MPSIDSLSMKPEVRRANERQSRDGNVGSRRAILRAIRATSLGRLLNIPRRGVQAMLHFTPRLRQLPVWLFRSREDTNYSYDLSEENLGYMAHVLSVATGLSYQYLLNLIHEGANDIALRHALFAYISHTPHRHYTDREVRFGRRLGWYALARALKPKVVIETGVDKGLGSVLLCAALLRNRDEGFVGRYYGTDINPNAGFLLKIPPYDSTGEILYGDSIDSLTSFNQKVDLFINDSDHSAEYEAREYEIIRSKLSDGAIIIGDNCHCNDRLATFSCDTGRHFIYFHEEPKDHWYPGVGFGISFPRDGSATDRDRPGKFAQQRSALNRNHNL